MAKSVVIPQDIIDTIIEAVGDDSPSLKNCAMVSSSFVLPTRKQLFSKLYLRSDDACQMLHQFLVENPVIQCFVKGITIGQNWNNSKLLNLNQTSLIGILRLPFCRLESFSLTGRMWYPSIWNDFSSELKDALSTIIRSSTLKTLRLCLIRNVPTMFFEGIHLTDLALSSLWLNDFDGKQSGLLIPAVAASEEVATTAAHTVVDWCTWHFFEPVRGTRFPTFVDLSLIWDVEGVTEPIFLPFMCRLRVLEIRIDPCSATMRDFGILSLLIRSLFISLTSPATLEHLKIDIVFKGSGYFDYYALFDEIRDAEVWSHLDSIITHPTGSRLQTVGVCITYSPRCDSKGVEPDETEVLEPFLDALPLLCEEGILYVQAILHE